MVKDKINLVAGSKISAEERCATGISGFDNLCEGGLISDSINLVIGNAGAGKTTFSLQFLNHGASKANENGLYVSFEPEITDLYRAGKKMGLDLETLDKKGKLKFVKFDTNSSIKEMQSKLTSLVAKYDIRRVVFDPINVFAIDLPKDTSSRRQIYDLLVLFKKLNVCVVIAGEADEDKEICLSEEITFSKYLVDGVVELYNSGISGEGDRALRIVKMRMTNHFIGPVGMNITSSGIKVLKP